MGLQFSEMVELGTPAPDFALEGIDGRTWRLADFADGKALLVVFMCNHCPYVKAVEDRLVELHRDYRERGLRMVGINPNDAEAYPEDSVDNMRRRAAERGYEFPYLVDAAQEVAKAYGAVCTPDFFLYGPDRALFYRGRLDDNWKEPAKVARKDLREAIEAVLAEAPYPSEQIPSMGCSIKWRT